jgi:hypothetical protein
MKNNTKTSIAAVCFQKNWLIEQAKKLVLPDPVLLEKCVYAMELLGSLADSGFPFVFKGGTSMLLLLPINALRRLSIDIDIVSEEPELVSETGLSEIVRNGIFLRCEEDVRGEQRLPKRKHFKFWYHSECSEREDYVLLDVLLEQNLYSAITQCRVGTELIPTERDILVSIPTIDALLADKLTAFAPSTVGVKLTDDSNMQVIKQLSDVAVLFQYATDITQIRDTFARICDAEIGYRGGNLSRQNVLEDIVATSCLIAMHNLKGEPKSNKDQARLLFGGAKKLTQHLIGGTIAIEEMKVFASRAAAIAELVANPSASVLLEDIRFDVGHINELGEITLKGPLNRLKQTNPEAFYLWHQITRIRPNATPGV